MRRIIHVYEQHGFYKVWSRDKSERGDGELRNVGIIRQ